MLRSDFPVYPDSRVICGAVAETPRGANCLAWPGLVAFYAMLGAELAGLAGQAGLLALAVIM